ncbi:MAG: short-chain dehydrogenase [Deltaproteobacteria bacterium]|nr:MAG: short-chain dehydrogenase [Deltaproteobacteria bacterium]
MPLNPDAIGKKIGPLTKDYTWKDVVLYALGVGAGFKELEYCYENNLKVIPSFSIGAVFEFLASVAMESNVNLAGILHAEQDIIFHNPIPPEGTLTTEGTITHIYDRGPDKGALVVAEAVTYHSNGKRLFTNIFTLFGRLDGGFGGEKPPSEKIEFPDRAPDHEERDLPTPDQPLIYRLSGDIFQLHVDPNFAKAAGFERPIMHGLCTHGFACRAVIRALFPGEPERMTRFKTRFSRPLYPGTPIKTQIWKLEEGKAIFRTVNDETGEIVIDQGIVEWMSREEMQKRLSRQGIRFDGRVAIVTGAGGGLGRVYALELAKRGAKVVVNDVGGARDGSGEGSMGPADKVVEEIKALGGEAVASYDSVATPEGGEAIVRRAVEAFGGVDILINNAGILRDRSFGKMGVDDWEEVIKVHLMGAYNVTRPAFLKMREKGYGRVVMTTSAAGLFGNFGQANYSAAKMGVVGLMNTLKLEGEKYGIKVNTVAPLAGTRLTEDVLPEDLFERLKPEYVAPMVLYLASEKFQETGMIFNAGMGHFSRVAVVQGPGVVVGDGSIVPTPEELQRSWESIDNLEGAEEYYNATVALGPMMEAVSGGGGGVGEVSGGLTVSGVFERMADAFQADKAGGVDVVFQYRISGPGGGDWYAVIKDGECEVREGLHERPTTTILMEEGDFLALMEGRLNAMSAYTSGKLKIEGDLMKSQLIEKLFKF